MSDSSVITFDNKEYVWQEVPGMGKCLVPYVKPTPPRQKVGVKDVQTLSTYYNSFGYQMRIVLVRLPPETVNCTFGEVKYYTILNQDNLQSPVVQSSFAAASIACQINEFQPSSMKHINAVDDISFGYWA